MSISTNTSLLSVTEDIENATGLPNIHYTSNETFEEEKYAVLFNNWSGLAFGKDIPKIGDARPVDFLGMPLLIVRNKANDINVFQNTCRHRGMLLLSEPKNVRGLFRCPYHSWCYDTDGALTSTPHVGGIGKHDHKAIEKKKLGLFQVRSHVWKDIIFINISGTAPDFEVYFSDLLSRWKEFEQPMIYGGTGSSALLEVKTNWKLAVENYCESYHLPYIHPELNRYSKIEDHYNIDNIETFSGQGTSVYQQLKGENETVLPDFSNLSKKWNTGAEYIAMYPNVLLGAQRDHFYAIILEPIKIDMTVEHIAIYYAPKITAYPQAGKMKAANMSQWNKIFEEDIFVVEGMQKGRQGDMFDGGKFSPVMDGPTHTFHRWIATQIITQRKLSQRKKNIEEIVE